MTGLMKVGILLASAVAVAGGVIVYKKYSKEIDEMIDGFIGKVTSDELADEIWGM